MPRRRKKPTAAQLVKAYDEDPAVTILELQERFQLTYTEVFRPLKRAEVLRGPSSAREPETAVE